jgi:pseudouridine-5'-phosphate glycosidase
MKRAAITVAPEVGDALAAGQAVVALESTIISHGLPRPDNRGVAGQLEAGVRAAGAIPATIAVLDGVAHVGLTDAELDRVASDPDLRKLGARDLAPALAAGASGATTVSATAVLAAGAGIRVFGTGGLGGVHRGWAETWDESADLDALARTRLTVVCSGVKSILDIPATLQRLETLNVTVTGYRTRTFPGFYLHSSGYPVDWTLEHPADVAAAMLAQDAVGLDAALIVANPVALADQLDPAEHDRALAEALAAADAAGIGGQALTPWLLERLVAATGGRSLAANVAAVRGNVALAARIASAWAAMFTRP